MATPRADTYSAASGAGIYAGMPAPAALPAWATASVGQWAQISGTSVPGYIQAFCGMAVRDDATGVTVWHGASGGHGDNPTDNSVYSIDLNSATPTWQTLRGASDPTGTNTVNPTTAFFADGRPLPSHTYSTVHWMPGISRYVIWRAYGMGSAATGNFLNIHAFNPATNDWDAPNTWPSLSNTFFVSTMDPATGKAHSIQSTGIGTWSATTLASEGMQGLSTGGQRGSQVFDTKRKRVYHLCSGDNWTGGSSTITSILANPVDGSMQNISFNASAAYSDFLTSAPQFLHTALTYDADLDRFYFYFGGNSTNPGAYDTRKVYVVKPNGTTTWDMELMSVTGITPVPSEGGVNNKFRYISRWKLLILVCRNQNIYYLRTQ